MTTPTALVAGEDRMLIDGKLVRTASGATFDVIHPGTGEVAGVATDGTIDDMSAAIAAARRAFDETDWSTNHEFRRRCLLQLRDALVEEKEHLRRVITSEVGSPIMLADSIQLEWPINELAHWAEYATSFKYEKDLGIVDSIGAQSHAMQYYEPIGVVGAITAWNVPLYLNIATVGPALAAGNTVVLKPAQFTPWCGSELGRLVAEKTDIPAGVFNVVVSNSNDVPAALSADPRVDMITFVGSTATGRKILAAAAPTVKRVCLELGGKSANIFLDDADFNTFLPMAGGMICGHAGQGCTYNSRILVPRSRYDEAVAILKATMEAIPFGDPWDPQFFMGPLSSQMQLDKVLGLIDRAVKDGAKLIVGGKRAEGFTGYFVEPTLLIDVDPMSEIAQEEIFGPVITLIAFEDDDDAVRISNSTIYGLCGEVTSGSVERALKVAKRIRTGTMSINGAPYFSMAAPLGGYRQSGLGRRYSEEGFVEYLEIKTVGLPVGS
ncbi:MAG: aldehyde dehydrogenase family protein [Acidimicrobiia bacterium]